MNEPFLPIERLRLFSADGHAYHAFNHLIAARMGTLLLVPLHLLSISADEMRGGCPVPWAEVHAVLEYPSIRPVTNHDFVDRDSHVQQLEYLGLDPAACEMDYFTPMVNGKIKVLRLVHPCGVRYAVVLND